MTPLMIIVLQRVMYGKVRIQMISKILGMYWSHFPAQYC